MHRLLTAALLLASACAPGFRAIYPGMTTAEVTKAMGDLGPSTVTPFNDGYAAWYYGEDRCVLLRNDVVVSKATSYRQAGVSLPGVGSLSLKQPAECLPPGVQPRRTSEVNVGLPFGNVNVR